MAYSSKAVANYFLQRAFDEDIPVSPMKLQKLLYYAQGWHLAFNGTPIIKEQIECWKYGPVVSSIFHHFKDSGRDSITRKARHLKRSVDTETGRSTFKYVNPVLPSGLDSESRSVLEAVWESYKGISAIRLSNMTHEPGAPWHQVYMENDEDPPRGTDIPMSVMRSHFQALLDDS